MKRLPLTLAAILALGALSARAADVNVTANITQDTTWTADNDYLLGQPIFVTDGATLAIQPGTKIYGFEDVGAGTFGSLVITRGSKIMAEGTRSNPIEFTALDERDDDLTLEDSSLWGGLIILGNAVLNDAGNPLVQPDAPVLNEREIEGFPAGGNNELIKYGGLDDADNSGVLKYVSIRYGGFEFQTDEEINGLTLGAVGSGTTIEYVEVFNNSDDGVEFFGGTVNTKYMVMAFNEDEQFDIDQGYRGKGQFWFGIGKSVGNGSNYGGEHDGGDSPDKTLEPFARVKVFNATYLGSGVEGGNPQTNTAFRLKDNFAGQYHNSIFGDFPDQAVRIDDDPTKDRANTPGDLAFRSNLWFDIGSYDGTPESLTRNGSPEEIGVVSGNGNEYANPYLGGVSRNPHGGLDPRPHEDGAAYTLTRSPIPNDGFYDQVSYVGAFPHDDNWMEGWTYLSRKGYLPSAAPTSVADVNVTENITTDTVWTNDNNYILGQPIFVTDGATLTIEAGTTVYGFEDVANGTFGSLVVTRGCKIYAEGTRDNPIVFTALDARDEELTLEDSSLWGGLIILGNAILNDAGNPIIQPDNPVLNEREIEGFPAGGNNDFIKYGGLDDEDNSGALRFVSIRYGGFEFQTDEEINGLTLGAVGSGTKIEYVEVFNNSDDGVEFFGGTVDVRYLVMAFNEDEQYDIDQGYHGRGQHLFAIGKPVGNGSNYGGEHDGGDSPDKTLEPFARSQFYNVTYLGSGVDGGNPQTNTAFRLKDNFAGQYHNSIIGEFQDVAVRIDDDPTKARVDDGDLFFGNNSWYGFGGAEEGNFSSYTQNGSSQELLLLSEARGNTVDIDPMLRGVSREADGGLDPRPLGGSPALSAPLSAFPAGQAGFFTRAQYRGAFGAVNWAAGWTALSEEGFMSDGGTSNDVPVTANITTDTTWTANNAYILGQPIFVTDGATLTIEPGTTVYGFEDIDNGTFGSLVITRDSKIIAEGTKNDPIVFTALDERDGDLTLEDSSLWGGLIILGNAVLNDAGNPEIQPENPVLNEREIEGFPSGGNNDLIKYGGLDDDDDSGILKYVSIRFGGFEFQQDEEINGLTLGAVGRGTTIEYVEVFNNSDDGVEFFGGTVNTKHLVMAFNEDEQFDIDQGYRGMNQFWFGIGKSVGNGSNYGGEHDGGDSPDKTLEPFARTHIYNATYLGSGVKGGNPQTNTAFRLKDNFAGQYHNSIFGDFPDQAIRIDDDPTKERANTPGDLAFQNNLWFDVGSFDGTPESLTRNASPEEIKLVSENGNDYGNPYLAGISRRPYGGLDPRPLEGGPAYNHPQSTPPDNGFFEQTDYVGAFSSNDNWMEGWTYLSQKGYLAKPAPSSTTDVTVEANITTDTVWTNDKTYILGQPIFVTNDATLTIEAGTTVMGFEDIDAGTFGSLVVTRGAKIYAEGTRDNPVSFTALDERSGQLTLEDSSLWGGLIILGNAILNDAGNPIIQPDNPVLNEREIEGFPAGGNNDFIKYGGLDDSDDSGALRFVSIRYGGFEFETDEEINGLTLGAVGSGTTIEFVEVFNNSDDGVEFFGGTVDVRYLVMAFNEDEQYDIDQGYRGRGQFLFAIGKDIGNGSNYGGEHDGGDSPDKTLEPFARSKFYNVTYLGSGASGENPQTNAAFRLKDNFAGQYHNSIISDFGDYAVRIDDDPTKAQVNSGELFFGNNIWHGFGSGDGSNLADLTNNGSPEELLILSPERGNQVTDPFLRGISREANSGLDPRPSPGSPATVGELSAFPAEQSGFFAPVPFKGAFGDINWMNGWSYLSQDGYIGDLPGQGGLNDVTVTENITEDTTWTADKNYLLGEPIFVTNGATLTIEPGTTIYGFEDTALGTFGSLVITRGSKINADGTRENPIVFTALEERTEDLTLVDSSLWGGLIILGRAVLNDAGNPYIQPDNPVLNEREIEGFPAGGNNEFIKYGGLDDADDSGVLRYVSIRYGGFEFETDEEINGLTLGAVGSGTTIEYVEVFNNSDDGVEFFGGTVDVKYMVMAFNEDEQYDIDQGYRGRGQFLFAIGKSVGNGSNYGGEHDGGDSPDKTLEPFARNQFYNVTYLGSGAAGDNPQTNAAFRLKDNYAGQYHNSVIADFGDYAVRIDDDTTKARVNDGDLFFGNNTWFGFASGDGSNLTDLTRNGSPEELLILSPDRGNVVTDPLLRGVSRTPTGVLDPRPLNASPLLGAPLTELPDGDFFTQVSYRGAFGEENWMRGWTKLDEAGYLGDLDGGPDPEPTLADVTQPNDAIELVNGVNDDDGNDGPPPGAEGVENAINDVTQKYLNFLDLGSGLIVTPGVGATTVTGVALYTANDAVERDPASYKLEGSVAGAAGPWKVIAEGPLALPDERNPGGDIPITDDTFGQTLTFENPWAYTAYRLTFPTLKDAATANSMQIAEIELLGVAGGTLDPNPGPDPGVDSDNDGTPDDVEIANGTDPNDPTDFFKLTAAGDNTFTWSSGVGRSYDVEYSVDLANWSVISTVEAAEAQSSFQETDAGRLGIGEGYYRVILK